MVMLFSKSCEDKKNVRKAMLKFTACRFSSVAINEKLDHRRFVTHYQQGYPYFMTELIARRQYLPSDIALGRT